MTLGAHKEFPPTLKEHKPGIQNDETHWHIPHMMTIVNEKGETVLVPDPKIDGIMEVVAGKVQSLNLDYEGGEVSEEDKKYLDGYKAGFEAGHAKSYGVDVISAGGNKEDARYKRGFDQGFKCNPLWQARS